MIQWSHLQLGSVSFIDNLILNTQIEKSVEAKYVSLSSAIINNLISN